VLLRVDEHLRDDVVKLAGMASPGLRERKRARTRLHISDTAARLFAERGYENVAVTDVAREAEVAEQTVYNYFPTKEQLVTDRDQQVQEGLSDLIRSRPPGLPASPRRLPSVTSSSGSSPGSAASRRSSGVANSATWRPSARLCGGWHWR
jgi:AcrR family transcriptional regulator